MSAKCMLVISTGVARVSLTWSISGAMRSVLRSRRPIIGAGSMVGATVLAMADWPLVSVTADQVMSKMFFMIERPLVPPSEAVRSSEVETSPVAVVAAEGSGTDAVVSRAMIISSALCAPGSGAMSGA